VQTMRSEWTGGNGVPRTHVQHSVAYSDFWH